jgi:hypothetical protein
MGALVRQNLRHVREDDGHARFVAPVSTLP